MEKHKKKSRKKKGERSREMAEPIAADADPADKETNECGTVSNGADDRDDIAGDNNANSNRYLPYEKDISVLQERIEKLEMNDISHLQKECIVLHEEIEHMQRDLGLFHQKETMLHDDIAVLQKEIALSHEKEVKSLETTDTLETEIKMLNAEVVELDNSKRDLIASNQKLQEDMSSLHLHIQNIETSTSDKFLKFMSELEDCKFQIGSTRHFVDQLESENAELVQKLNEAYAKNGMRNGILPNEPLVESTGDTAIVEAGTQQHIHMSGEVQAIDSAEDAVPLSDAPLVGAPFRLFSFVAKYVTGADLAKSGHMNSES